MHHDALAPLSGLARLAWLDLRQNPLAAHPRHRARTAAWLRFADNMLGRKEEP